MNLVYRNRRRRGHDHWKGHLLELKKSIKPDVYLENNIYRIDDLGKIKKYCYGLNLFKISITVCSRKMMDSFYFLMMETQPNVELKHVYNYLHEWQINCNLGWMIRVSWNFYYFEYIMVQGKRFIHTISSFSK